jgi:hypothetical protein
MTAEAEVSKRQQVAMVEKRKRVRNPRAVANKHQQDLLKQAAQQMVRVQLSRALSDADMMDSLRFQMQTILQPET